MKIIASLLLLCAVAGGQTRIPTVTRTVRLFGELERKLAGADASTRESLLAEDFEERLCAEPGTPIPRADWLQKTAPSEITFSQEAVHSYGDVAVYSAQTTQSGSHSLIVDTWKQADGGWKLAVRYRCPATGEKPSDATVPKRY